MNKSVVFCRWEGERNMEFGPEYLTCEVGNWDDWWVNRPETDIGRQPVIWVYDVYFSEGKAELWHYEFWEAEDWLHYHSFTIRGK